MKIAAQLISLEDAAELIGARDGLWVGNALSIENPLIELLSYKGESVKGLTIVGSSHSKADEIFDPKYSGCIRIVSIHNLQSREGAESPATGENRMFQSVCGIFGINTVALRMSPPDADGNCSVETDAADLNDAICGNECVIRRIAMLDLSLPVSSATDGCAKMSIKNFDYVCSYKCTETLGSSIA